MLIGGDAMFVYIRARFRFALIGGNLTVQSTGSHREIGGDVVANSPSFSRPATRASRRACSQAKKRIQALWETCKTDVGRIIYEKRKRTIPLKTSHSLNLDNQQTNLRFLFWSSSRQNVWHLLFRCLSGTSTEARHSLVNWTHVEYLLWPGGAFGFWSFHSHL